MDPARPQRLPRPVADPLPRPDLVPGAHPPGRRGPGRAAVAGRRDGGGALEPRASRTPTCRSRARATASAAREHHPAASRPSSRSSARSSASRRPTTCRRSRSRASTRSRRRPARPEAWRPADPPLVTARPRPPPRRLVRRCPDRGRPRAARRSRRCSPARPPDRHPEPILLVLGGLALGLVPGLPADRARARSSCSCCSCRRSCSRRATSPRSATSRQPPPDPAAVGRARGVHDAWSWRSCRGTRPGHALGGGVRARRDRRAARRGGGDDGLPAARRAAPGRHDPRGREPRQRRDGAGRLPLRTSIAASGGTFSIVDRGVDFVVVAVGGIAFGLVVGLDRRRWSTSGSTTRTSGSCSRSSPRRWPTCPRSARRPRRARGRRRGHLRRAASPPASLSSPAPPRRRRAPGRSSCSSSTARCSSSSGCSSGRCSRASAGTPGQLLGLAVADRRDRDRRPVRVGLPGHVRPARAVGAASACASRTRRGGTC